MFQPISVLNLCPGDIITAGDYRPIGARCTIEPWQTFTVIPDAGSPSVHEATEEGYPDHVWVWCNDAHGSTRILMYHLDDEVWVWRAVASHAA